MKRAGQRMTIDYFDPADVPPAPGMVFRDVSASGRVRGYCRIQAARKVKVRVSRGEVARYAVWFERLAGDRPPHEGADFTVTANPRKPKRDRWSPLLPP